MSLLPPPPLLLFLNICWPVVVVIIQFDEPHKRTPKGWVLIREILTDVAPYVVGRLGVIGRLLLLYWKSDASQGAWRSTYWAYALLPLLASEGLIHSLKKTASLFLQLIFLNFVKFCDWPSAGLDLSLILFLKAFVNTLKRIIRNNRNAKRGFYKAISVKIFWDFQLLKFLWKLEFFSPMISASFGKRSTNYAF